MDVAHIVINDFGGAPIAEHNMPCAVCLMNHAVYQLNSGEFDPCWTCQEQGYRLVDLESLPWIVRKYLYWRDANRPRGLHP